MLFLCCAAAPHTFTAQEADWGFAETVSLDVVYDEKNGFMQNGIIIIRVKVRTLSLCTYHYFTSLP